MQIVTVGLASNDRLRHNPHVTDRPPRPPRADTREVAELKQIKASQPELASAVDMQLALVDMQRRVQGRVPLPWIQVSPEWMRSQQSAGRPLVRFNDIPLEWSDFRLTFRQTADILQRFDAVERVDYQKIVALGRDGNTLEPIVRQWYEASSGVYGNIDPTARVPPDAPSSIEQVLVLALRPFLARCAEALAQRSEVNEWSHGHCPYCGWEPDFAVITPNADRRLICGRCVAQWTYHALTC